MALARFSILLMATIVFTACSNKEIYEGLQRRNEVDCFKLPVAQQQDCLDKARALSYEEYERELKSTAGNPQH